MQRLQSVRTVCQSLVTAEENGFGAVAVCNSESSRYAGCSSQALVSSTLVQGLPFDPPRGSESAVVQLQDWQILCLVVVGPSAYLCLVFRSWETLCSPPSGQDHEGVPRHAAELKSKSPVEEHDEHAVDPLEDGGGVLQGEAVLAKENSAWGSEVKENNGCTAGVTVSHTWSHTHTTQNLSLSIRYIVYCFLSNQCETLLSPAGGHTTHHKHPPSSC